MKNQNFISGELDKIDIDSDDLEAFLMLFVEPYLSEKNEVLYRFKAS